MHRHPRHKTHRKSKRSNLCGEYRNMLTMEDSPLLSILKTNIRYKEKAK